MQMVYSLKWSASFINDSGVATFKTVPSPSGVGNFGLSYTIQNGVSVQKADVLGYYIQQNSNPIRMGYFNTTMESPIAHSDVYSLEGTDAPLCNISLCDSSLKLIPHTAPLIYAILGK